MSAPPPASVRPATVGVAQDEVLTGEAVALDVQPLGFFLRCLGAVIDLVVAIGVFTVFAFGVGALAQGGLMPAGTNGIVQIALLVLVVVVLPTVVETASHGRSLGRLAVGGRIVRTDGGASGFRQAFIRALVGVLEIWMTAGAVAGLVGAFTPRSQRLGDLIAGTYSERTRAPALPAPAPPLPAGMEGWAEIADVGRLPDRLARRIAQFVRQVPGLDPAARQRLAATLTAEAAAFVAPLPAVPPEVLLLALVAVRREREHTALLRKAEQVAALTAGLDGDRGLRAAQ